MLILDASLEGCCGGPQSPILVEEPETVLDGDKPNNDALSSLLLCGQQLTAMIKELKSLRVDQDKALSDLQTQLSILRQWAKAVSVSDNTPEGEAVVDWVDLSRLESGETVKHLTLYLNSVDVLYSNVLIPYFSLVGAWIQTWTNNPLALQPPMPRFAVKNLAPSFSFVHGRNDGQAVVSHHTTTDSLSGDKIYLTVPADEVKEPDRFLSMSLSLKKDNEQTAIANPPTLDVPLCKKHIRDMIDRVDESAIRTHTADNISLLILKLENMSKKLTGIFDKVHQDGFPMDNLSQVVKGCYTNKANLVPAIEALHGFSTIGIVTSTQHDLAGYLKALDLFETTEPVEETDDTESNPTSQSTTTDDEPEEEDFIEEASDDEPSVSEEEPGDKEDEGT